MKSGEAGFRHSRTPQAVKPVSLRKVATDTSNRSESGPSKRSQRRFEEAEERRRKRKERKRAARSSDT
jgi:hypothetical protein